MPPSDCFPRTRFCFPTLSTNKLALGILVMLFAGLSCLAQEPAPAGQSNAPPQEAIQRSNWLVPAGTRIALVLTHPIQSRYLHRGDDIYAQITSPVLSGNEVAIPPGTFVQGKVDKLGRKGGRGELHLQSAAITFPNGYVAPIAAPLTMESDEGYAIKDPGDRRMVSAFVMPLAGAGLGALIGHAAANSQPQTITSTLPPGCTGPPPGCITSSLTVPGSTGKSTIIGAGVGGAVGALASLVMIMSSRNFYLDVGSPVDMVLQQPLSLERDEVAEAIRQSSSQPVQPTAPRPQPVPPQPTPRLPNPSRGPFDCPAGEEWCNGSCVDVARFINDSNNCGRCGNHCSFSETCTGGSCTCGPGYSSCMGSCVSDASFLGDSSNCGRCGNMCSIGESCLGGTCTRTTPCTPGDVNCH